MTPGETAYDGIGIAFGIGYLATVLVLVSAVLLGARLRVAGPAGPVLGGRALDQRCGTEISHTAWKGGPSAAGGIGCGRKTLSLDSQPSAVGSGTLSKARVQPLPKEDRQENQRSARVQSSSRCWRWSAG